MTPVRLAVTVNKLNLTHELIMKSKAFAVSVLNESTPMPFLELFGFQTGRKVDKLSQVDYKTGITDSPVVMENAAATLEAVVFKEIDLGTHTIFIGNAVASEFISREDLLTYKYYRDDLNGAIPKNAPAYIPA